MNCYNYSALLISPFLVDEGLSLYVLIGDDSKIQVQTKVSSEQNNTEEEYPWPSMARCVVDLVNKDEETNSKLLSKD